MREALMVMATQKTRAWLMIFQVGCCENFFERW
jgi:hypothetical protein